MRIISRRDKAARVFTLHTLRPYMHSLSRCYYSECTLFTKKRDGCVNSDVADSWNDLTRYWLKCN